MRAFGDIQGMIIAEGALDHAATAIGMTAEDVRELNLYATGQVTPYGQALTYCYMRDVWQKTKEKSDYVKRRAAVDAFNAAQLLAQARHLARSDQVRVRLQPRVAGAGECHRRDLRSATAAW